MKKIFVSVPFKDRTEDEVKRSLQIVANKYIMKNYAGKPNPVFTKEIEFVNNYMLTDEEVETAKTMKHPKVYYLSLALRKMAECDDVIFDEDWGGYYGCVMEHFVYSHFIAEGS